MHFVSLLLFSLSASLVSAWLPEDNVDRLTGQREAPTVHLLDLGQQQAPLQNSSYRESRVKVQDHRDGYNASTFHVEWLPAVNKIRGVNLGGWLIVEPWMMWDEWNSMSCSSQRSEFDCVMYLGQATANAKFQTHWGNWITTADLDEIVSLGLNTIRIPVGYWIREDIVYLDSEYFPQGAFGYLENIVGAASDRGLYIIIDLHGAPGAQVKQNSFTGQFAPTPGFYVDYQYERTYKFLEWMTNIIHTNSKFRNVGAIEVVNEPVSAWEYPSQAASLISTFYPTAWKRIRAVENTLRVASNNRLHIQMMNQKWGSGNPNQNLDDLYFAFYDDHRYPKWDTNVPQTKNGYLAASCGDDRGGNSPVVVGEWSLSVADSVEWGDTFRPDADGAAAWYRQWWAAQVLAYEKQKGWIFWTWKVNWIAGRNDWRWGYQQAVAAGAIPKDAGQAQAMNPCY